MTEYRVEVYCRDAVFHFNKKHLEDQTIPMWVVKAKGETYYVEHVDCEVPWSTKETKDNPHTKGSIKLRNCIVRIDDENCASIVKASMDDIIRLKEQAKPRHILMTRAYPMDGNLESAIKQLNIPHGEFKKIRGVCSTPYDLAEVYSTDFMTMLKLLCPNVRELQPNEDYYQGFVQEDGDRIDGIYEYDYDDDDEDY